MQNPKYIVIENSTKEKLDEQKIIARETYNDLFKRILKKLNSEDISIL